MEWKRILGTVGLTALLTCAAKGPTHLERIEKSPSEKLTRFLPQEGPKAGEELSFYEDTMMNAALYMDEKTKTAKVLGMRYDPSCSIIKGTLYKEMQYIEGDLSTLLNTLEIQDKVAVEKASETTTGMFNYLFGKLEKTNCP